MIDDGLGCTIDSCDESSDLIMHSNSPCEEIPEVDEFDSVNETTDFDNEVNMSNVTGLILATISGQIEFDNDYSINASNEEYDANVNIGNNFVSVASENLNPSFNNSAMITLYNVSCDDPEVYYGLSTYQNHVEIIEELNICDGTTDPECTEITCQDNTKTFRISHFTGYAATSISQLEIWDSNDLTMPFADEKFTGENVVFYTNYSDFSNTILGAECIISFADGTNELMSYNVNGYYEFSKSFSSADNYVYEVSCERLGFDSLDVTDDLLIVGATVCGDNVCSNDESCNTCSDDCGSCPIKKSFTSNSVSSSSKISRTLKEHKTNPEKYARVEVLRKSPKENSTKILNSSIKAQSIDFILNDTRMNKPISSEFEKYSKAMGSMMFLVMIVLFGYFMSLYVVGVRRHTRHNEIKHFKKKHRDTKKDMEELEEIFKSI